MSINTSQANRRILIVDDNPAIHSDFKKILCNGGSRNATLEMAEAELFGIEQTEPDPRQSFELSSAMQGEEALEAVHNSLQEQRPFAMAFVDVRMPPGLDGIETTTRLWAVDPDLQVAVCTAYSDYSWEDMISRLGVSDRLVLLKKPFDSVEVLQLASALTEKWRLLQTTRSQLLDLENRVRTRTEELRKSEERYRLITENAADLISIIDNNGQFIYHSPSYQRLLGFSPEELSFAGNLAQVHPEDRSRAGGMVEDIVRSGAGRVVEYRLCHRDGSYRTVESHGAPFRNGAGVVDGILVVSRDVTDRKEAENQRQLLEVQLRQAQKLESIGQLAAGIAHEINTPIQFIGDNTRFVRDGFRTLQNVFDAQKRFIDAAREGVVNPEDLQSLESAVKDADLDYLSAEIPTAIAESLDGIERVSQIVMAMKQFCHQGPEDRTAADLHACIQSTLTVCRNEWRYLADMVTDFDSTIPPIYLSKGAFNQAILNLVVNAAHAIEDAAKAGGPAKGTITVSTRLDGDKVEIQVSDTGTGIPPGVQERIFDPFFTTKSVGRGTGQGLVIARSVIVDKHGGTLTFKTEPGKGTTFVIRMGFLPSKDQEASQPAIHHES